MLPGIFMSGADCASNGRRTRAQGFQEIAKLNKHGQTYCSCMPSSFASSWRLDVNLEHFPHHTDLSNCDSVASASGSW